MITTAYVAGLLTGAYLLALIRLASGDGATRLPTEHQPEPAEDGEEEDYNRPWRESWKLRAQACLEELRAAQCSAERIEALRWARRLHFERRSHTYQDEDALEDAVAFWEEVNDEFRPGGPG